MASLCDSQDHQALGRVLSAQTAPQGPLLPSQADPPATGQGRGFIRLQLMGGDEGQKAVNRGPVLFPNLVPVGVDQPRLRWNQGERLGQDNG